MVSLSAQALELTSPDVKPGAGLALDQVNSRCGGGDHSPALAWSGEPAGTRSFAITMFDPDAGGGRGFWHWLVMDIPAGTRSLPVDAGAGAGLPERSIQTENDFGEPRYGGACPPRGSGVHHYVFTLYALDQAAAPTRSGPAVLSPFLKQHALATATLTAIYSR
ncbi:MAG TPA: YbhB/YbcL family Raf kinase inhibitor-like protein [Rhizomicrobium sp.]